MRAVRNWNAAAAAAAWRRAVVVAIAIAAAAAAFSALPAATAVAADSSPIGLQLTLSAFAGGAKWAEPELVTPASSGVNFAAASDGVHFGGRAGLAFNRWLGIEGTYGVSPHGSDVDDARVNHVGTDVVLSLPLFERVTPYVTGGWAQLEFDADQDQLQTLNGWEYGGGVRIGLVRALALRLDVRDVLVDDDGADNWEHNILYTAGLHLALGGRMRDSDADGVADASDRCPDTPIGAVVNADGCPSDADNDGVWDGIDACANTPAGARVDARGCPLDSDGDGVADGIDECPDTARGSTVDARGCPQDADGDGVADGADRCPNTPTGATVDAVGCPVDSDGDGVFDGLDACPDTPRGARVDVRGCPVPVREKETLLLETGMLRLDNVHFDTGKAILRPESEPVLDEVGAILVDWPQLRVEIGGHTDSSGSGAFNQALSQRRAQAVLDYLQAKFPAIRDTQHTVVGYGEAQPVADNRTRAGRAQNRRVEFKVLDRETLRKEIERRQN